MRLETRRLILRELDPGACADAAFMLALLNSKGWRTMLGDVGVRDQTGAAKYIERACASSFHEHGHGMYGVERQLDGMLIGISGLIKREGVDDVDLGFGFLEEACGAGLERVAAITIEDNAASMAVLSKLGFRKVKVMGLKPGGDELTLLTVTLGA